MWTKSQFKIRKSKIAQRETPTLKLGQTPVMTVPQVCIFVDFAERQPCHLKICN